MMTHRSMKAGGCFCSTTAYHRKLLIYLHNESSHTPSLANGKTVVGGDSFYSIVLYEQFIERRRELSNVPASE